MQMLAARGVYQQQKKKKGDDIASVQRDASIDSAPKPRRMAEPRTSSALLGKLVGPLFELSVIHRLAAISPTSPPKSALNSAQPRPAYPPSTGRNQREDSASVIGSRAAEGVGVLQEV